MFEEMTEKEKTAANPDPLPQYSFTALSGCSSLSGFEEKLSSHHQEGFVDTQKQVLNNTGKESQLLSCTQLGCDVGDRIHEMHDEGFYHQHFESSYRGCNMVMPYLSPGVPYPSTMDLVTLLHQSNLFLPFAADSTSSSSDFCGPVFHLNPPLQPPLRGELLCSMPHIQGAPSSWSLSGTLLDEGDNGITEGTSHEVKVVAKAARRKHFNSERERRVHFNDRYEALRNLIPNPSKTDKASILGDAIEYIKELVKTVQGLESLVEKKRCERGKRHRTERDAAAAFVQKPLRDPEQCYNSSLRSSSFQRKWKDTEVDIRIIGDEVTIKLVKRKLKNCFTIVSKALEELQLDLQDVSGGHVGDYCSMWLTTKIYEGSSVYANAIADRLIQVLEGHGAAICHSSSC